MNGWLGGGGGGGGGGMWTGVIRKMSEAQKIIISTTALSFGTILSKYYLKVVSATFLLVCFACLKDVKQLVK